MTMLNEKENTPTKNEILNALHNGKLPIIIDFVKKDGTERTMLATLNSIYIPDEDEDYNKRKTKNTKTNPDVQVVYDVEKSAFRSVRWDAITKVDLQERN